MAGVRVHVVMPRVMVERVDAVLSEGVSRGEFVRRAVERALEVGPGRVGVPEARPAASRAETQAVPSPAPAEQPELSRVEAFRRATQKR